MVVKGVGCDLFVASGRPLRGESRPRGVYRGLRSPAALASPVLSVDPAVFTTAADARQLASSAGSRGERRPRGKLCGRRSTCGSERRPVFVFEIPATALRPLVSYGLPVSVQVDLL